MSRDGKAFVIRAVIRIPADDPRDQEEIHADVLRALTSRGISTDSLITQRGETT